MECRKADMKGPQNLYGELQIEYNSFHEAMPYTCAAVLPFGVPILCVELIRFWSCRMAPHSSLSKAVPFGQKCCSIRLVFSAESFSHAAQA